MNIENTLFQKFEIVNFKDIKTRDFIKSYDINVISKNNEYFMEYFIEGSKNLDTISFELYKDASYYWTIIMANNIQDVFMDLPLTEEELKKTVLKRLESDEKDISYYFEYYNIEEAKNNAKRTIKVINPAYLFSFISLLNRAD